MSSDGHHYRCKRVAGEWICAPSCLVGSLVDDTIHRPSHYVSGRKYEPLDVILDWRLPFLLGQVVKYVSRAGRKGSAVEDLRKAEFYLRREIQRLEAEAEVDA